MSVGVKYNQSSDNPAEWTYEATCDDHGSLFITADEDDAYTAAHAHRAFAHRVVTRYVPGPVTGYAFGLDTIFVWRGPDVLA